MTLLKWMAAVAVASAGGVALAADTVPQDPDLLPWGERLGDYRLLTGEELRETMTGSFISHDESRTRPRLRDGGIGFAFCDNERLISISNRYSYAQKMNTSTYDLRDAEYCFNGNNNIRGLSP